MNVEPARFYQTHKRHLSGGEAHDPLNVLKEDHYRSFRVRAQSPRRCAPWMDTRSRVFGRPEPERHRARSTDTWRSQIFFTKYHDAETHRKQKQLAAQQEDPRRMNGPVRVGPIAKIDNDEKMAQAVFEKLESLTNDRNHHVHAAHQQCYQEEEEEDREPPRAARDFSNAQRCDETENCLEAGGCQLNGGYRNPDEVFEEDYGNRMLRNDSESGQNTTKSA